MDFTKLFLIVITALVSGLSVNAQAAGPSSGSVGMTDFKQKAEAKKQSRWTLSEWLEQKDRNRMMDLWLGMYAPSPYEFILGGQYNTYDTRITSPTETRTHYNSYSGTVAFYAMILGVEGNYENNTAEGFQNVEGLVNLRVLGNSNQGTHLNVMYGARKRTQEGFDLNQQVAGVELDLYIEKHIGLHGLYRNYFPVEEPNWGTTSGSKSEVGAFFDLSLIRFYGNWFTNNMSSTLNTIKTERNRSGFEYGLKFYF